MIHLGEHVDLPLDVVTQKIAFIARSGAGKTYAASKLAEQMWKAGHHFVVIDPVGVWYGLRLDESGEQPSDISIPVLGGEHGDVPLDPSAGELVAAMVVEKGLRCVLDVSSMRKKQRRDFVTSFARAHPDLFLDA